MVAIPAVVGFNFFQGRVRKSLARVDSMAHLVLSAAAPGGARAAGN
jgi:biopolymer transport protein ExbB/TolQ